MTNNNGIAEFSGVTFKGRRLKVCIGTMAPFLGGAEVAAERLGLGLQQRGHEVLMLIGQQGPVLERMTRAGLHCIHTPLWMTSKRHVLRYFLDRYRLRRLLRSERPDVLHSNDLASHQMLSGAAQGLGIVRVCHHRFPYTGRSTDWYNKYGAEQHVFVSKALMEGMCAGDSATLQRKLVTYIYDGIPLPPKPMPSDRNLARANLDLPQDRVIVLFAGQIIARKGVADLLKAWSGMDDATLAAASLVIVGDDLRGEGSYRREMEQLAQKLRCQARFVGFQTNVGEWLTAADITVVPSLVEPLGNATLEAMAHALPVVAAAVGGIPEMVVHGQTGILVPPQAPEELAVGLRTLIWDAEMRTCFGEAGRKRCEQVFGLDAHVDAIVKEYHNLLSRRDAEAVVARR
jgi:glycosyltransferase involved in cell wall biosynthesis